MMIGPDVAEMAATTCAWMRNRWARIEIPLYTVEALVAAEKALRSPFEPAEWL